MCSAWRFRLSCSPSQHRWKSTPWWTCALFGVVGLSKNVLTKDDSTLVAYFPYMFIGRYANKTRDSVCTNKTGYWHVSRKTHEKESFRVSKCFDSQKAQKRAIFGLRKQVYTIETQSEHTVCVCLVLQWAWGYSISVRPVMRLVHLITSPFALGPVFPLEPYLVPWQGRLYLLASPCPRTVP